MELKNLELAMYAWTKPLVWLKGLHKRRAMTGEKQQKATNLRANIQTLIEWKSSKPQRNKTQLLLDIHRARRHEFNEERAWNSLKEEYGSKIRPQNRMPTWELKTQLQKWQHPLPLSVQRFGRVKRKQNQGSKERAFHGFFNPDALVMSHSEGLGRVKHGNLWRGEAVAGNWTELVLIDPPPFFFLPFLIHSKFFSVGFGFLPLFSPDIHLHYFIKFLLFY